MKGLWDFARGMDIEVCKDRRCTRACEKSTVRRTVRGM